MEENKSHILDAHGEELMSQFIANRPVFLRMEQIICEKLGEVLRHQDMMLIGLEHRVKQEKSLAGKLELKGAKYATLSDITDLVGVRIITFYTDDVDKVAAIVKHVFDVDWEHSIDKRKMHSLNSFGYNSLHYICRLPKKIVDDPEMPQLNTFCFEIQMRTALQHVWSAIEHDTGYKGIVQLPAAYRRQFSRLAGMLELIDDEFSRLRTSVTDYNRKVQSLVASGKLDEVPLRQDTFRAYLEMSPFKALNQRIAASNQAEICPFPLFSFLRVFQRLGLETIGDIEQLIKENEDEAYQLAVSQLALTDIDIILENVAPMNLCFIYVLKKGEGIAGLRNVYDLLNGYRPDNEFMAQMTMDLAQSLPFIAKK